MAFSADFYGDGSFDFISDQLCDGPYLRNAHKAITLTGMWNWFGSFEPNDKESFMFSSHPNMKIIQNKMFEEDIAHGHSGMSFGITLRQMHYIARNGYDAFRTLWIANNLSPQNDEIIPNVEKKYENQLDKIIM